MNCSQHGVALQHLACPPLLSALLQQKMLWRKHRLNLVTTSRDIGTYEALLSRKSVKQAAAEGDGMAVSPRIAEVRQSCPPRRDLKPSECLLLMLNTNSLHACSTGQQLDHPAHTACSTASICKAAAYSLQYCPLL